MATSPYLNRPLRPLAEVEALRATLSPSIFPTVYRCQNCGTLSNALVHCLERGASREG